MKNFSTSIVLALLSSACAANLRTKPAWPNSANNAPIPNKQAAHKEYRLTLSNYKGVQYFAPITLNDQKMYAVYDTGSFDVMAMSKACTACKVPSPLIKYDNTSSTFKAGNGVITNHHFAGGLVVGKQDFETVHIGDGGKAFVVENMPFWQVMHTEMRVWLGGRSQFTGIVGLGHREAVPHTGVDSILERTGTHRFSICLQKGGTPGLPGYIYFNPQSTASFTAAQFAATGSNGMYRRLPVIGKNHWTITMNQAATSTSGTVTDTRCNAGAGPAGACVAIIDSGTSLIGVPPMAVPMITKLTKQVKQDCSNIDSLPDLVFTLAGQKFVLPSSAWVIRFKTTNFMGSVTKCLPAFTDFSMMSAHGNMWILGMPFLRHFYTVFDRSEPAIYVADQGANCAPVAQNTTANFVGVRKPHEEPSFADPSEATLPSWAYGDAKLLAL